MFFVMFVLFFLRDSFRETGQVWLGSGPGATSGFSAGSVLIAVVSGGTVVLVSKIMSFTI